MALKRKRSVSAFSPFSDSSSGASYSEREISSSPTPFHQTCATYPDDDTAMGGTGHQLHQIDNWTMTISPMADVTPQHLHSRTRKRFRDGRPEESVVHANTCQKLFSAQHSPTPHPQPTPALPRATSSSSASSQTRKPAQASLHNFWALPHRQSFSRSSSSALDILHLQAPQLKCEDCERCVGMGSDQNGIDVDMDGVVVEDAEYKCKDCRRVVCDMCAVVTVGEGRECLQCKTSRKKWVGGIGWMQPAYL